MKNHNRALPILAMTGFDDVSRRIELLRAGVSDYVIKPFIDEELVIRVRNHIMNKHLLDKIEQQQLHMQDIALKDGLTSLYNRHFLTEMAPKKINEAQRHSIPLSLILIDVDNFKSINDRYGHLQGDVVLNSIAEILLANCRQEDIAARLGGDEFLLMLSHCDIEGGYRKGEHLCDEISAKLKKDPRVTVSVGVSSLPPNLKCDFTKLFSAADEAVYKAKSEGKGRVESKPLKLK
jgi:two-component system cell cycle response regulator